MTVPTQTQATTTMPQQPAPGQTAGQAGQAQIQPRGQAPRHQTGFFYPRWALLAAMCYMLLALIGFAIHYYFSVIAPCNLGLAQVICTLDVQPGPIEVTMLLLGFLLVLFIAATFGRMSENEQNLVRASEPPPFAAFLQRITNFQRVRELATIICWMMIIGLLLEVVRSQLDAVTLTLGLITLFACAHAATYRPRRPARASQADSREVTPEQLAHERSLAREASFWSVARNTPPFVWIFRTRHE